MSKIDYTGFSNVYLKGIYSNQNVFRRNNLDFSGPEVSEEEITAERYNSSLQI